MTTIDIKPFINNDNAIEYYHTSEKLIYITDLLGCSVDHPAVEALEDCLEMVANSLVNTSK